MAKRKRRISMTARIQDLVQKSSPNTKRPRLPNEIEDQFTDVDRASAACYAQLEALSITAAELARDLSEEEEPSNGEVNPVVVDFGYGDDDSEDSLVINLNEVRRSVEKVRHDSEGE